MKGFIEFVRDQGVVGLAVGFILGGAISKVVASLVNDVVNPLLAPILGATGELKDAILVIGPVKLQYGSFLGTLMDFLIIALVVYFGVKILKLDRLDRKKT